jgi:hypothetical protein
MNGRNCQLCGKPLSRFTVGSGGEFCSREHRNQFRLRLGMDRLLEANKVASLMRRRENAKAIPAAKLASDCKVLPRSAAPLRLPVRQPAIHSLLPRSAMLEATRIAADSGNPICPRPAADAGRGVARPLETTGFFASRQVRLVLPPRAIQCPVEIAPAGAVALRPAGAGAPRCPRQPAALGPAAVRTHIGGNGIQLRPLPPSANRCSWEPQRPRRLASSAERGKELRVSGGAGFHLPAARIREVPLAAPRTTPLLNSPRPRALAAASLPVDAARRPAAVALSARGLFGPVPPASDSRVKFCWPGAIVPGVQPALGSAGASRSCQTAWRVAAPRAPRSQFHNAAAHLAASRAPLPFSAPPEPRGIQPVRRLTLVRFEGQDSPFEYSPAAIHGTLVGGMQFGPPVVRKPDPAQAASLQDHFDAGWHDWVGGTDDWKVDAAGVRTGSLALFAPSIEMADYDLEFLARIENRSVTWVFRAANFNDYYRATLAVAPGGYELRRGAVIAGAAEAVTVKPVASGMATPAARTAVTVRTHAAGNEFSISLDGTVIDTWTDSRLTLGGIGFASAPDDRARLYWVKVTPAGHASKEYRKP